MSAPRATWISLALLATALIFTACLYPSLPHRLPIHWNLHGQPDGWAPKQIAVLLLPGTMAALLGLMAVLPALSPRSFEIDRFADTFHYLMLVVVALMGFLHGVMVLSGLHPEIDMGRPLMGGLVLFVGAMANSLGKTRKNFFMGIRTPWTLASDRVWMGTHRFAGKVIVTTCLVAWVGLLNGASISGCFSLVCLSWLAPIVYSYILYRRLDAENKLGG